MLLWRSGQPKYVGWRHREKDGRGVVDFGLMLLLAAESRVSEHLPRIYGGGSVPVK